MRISSGLAAIFLVATPALADETSGTVLAFDRQAHVIVMEDKTVWPLTDKTLVSDDLVAGDIITIVFTSDGDNGVVSVDSVTK